MNSRLLSAKKAGSSYSNPSNQFCFGLVDILVEIKLPLKNNGLVSVVSHTLVFSNTIV